MGTEAEQNFQMFQLLRLELNVSKWENVSLTECNAFQALKKAHDEAAGKAGSLREAEGMSPWDIIEMKYSKMRQKLEKEAREEKRVKEENLMQAQKAYDAAAAALEYTEVQQEAAKTAVHASGDWLLLSQNPFIKTTHISPQPKSDWRQTRIGCT